MSRPIAAQTQRLLVIMERHRLSRTDVAEMLGCSIKTVSCWRCESPRPIPVRELERLELKLELRRLNIRLQYLEAGFKPPRSVTGAVSCAD